MVGIRWRGMLPQSLTSTGSIGAGWGIRPAVMSTIVDIGKGSSMSAPACLRDIEQGASDRRADELRLQRLEEFVEHVRGLVEQDATLAGDLAHAFAKLDR